MKKFKARARMETAKVIEAQDGIPTILLCRECRGTCDEWADLMRNLSTATTKVTASEFSMVLDLSFNCEP